MTSRLLDSHRRRFVLGVLLGLLSVSLVTLSAGCSSSPAETTTTRAPAPDFSGVTLDGEAVSLSDYSGRPLVLVFMGSWCAPCRAESPEIQQFYEENEDQAALLAVAVSDSEDDLRAFMIDKDLSFPAMLDTSGVANAYGIGPIPATVIIDSEGYIAKRIIGGTTAYALSLIIDGITR